MSHFKAFRAALCCLVLAGLACESRQAWSAGAVSCDSLGATGWSVNTSTSLEKAPTITSDGKSICSGGYARVRRINIDNTIDTKCVPAEKCSGTGISKLCVKQVNAAAFPTYFCASCTKTVQTDGSCT